MHHYFPSNNRPDPSLTDDIAQNNKQFAPTIHAKPIFSDYETSDHSADKFWSGISDYG